MPKEKWVDVKDMEKRMNDMKLIKSVLITMGIFAFFGLAIWQSSQLGYDYGYDLGLNQSNNISFDEGYETGAREIVLYMYSQNATLPIEDKICGCFSYDGGEVNEMAN